MSHEESTSTASSRRSRPAPNRGHQPTLAQLARLGIKVRDFAHESTLPPVRTVYRQPRQVQPGVARQLHRVDTEPVSDSPQSQSQNGRPLFARTITERTLENEPGPSIAREFGGFFEISGSRDRIVNFRPIRIHPENPAYSQAIQPLIASQETGILVPTPTVTPNGSLQWKEPTTQSERGNTPLSHLQPSLSRFSSPLTPSPPSPPTLQDSSFLPIINRSPSTASLEPPFPKRRKIVIDNDNTRPGMNRYYLRKRSLPSKHVSPTKQFHPSPRSRTLSISSDHLRRKNNVESSSSSSRPLHKHVRTTKGRRRS